MLGMKLKLLYLCIVIQKALASGQVNTGASGGVNGLIHFNREELERGNYASPLGSSKGAMPPEGWSGMRMGPKAFS